MFRSNFKIIALLFLSLTGCSEDLDIRYVSFQIEIRPDNPGIKIDYIHFVSPPGFAASSIKGPQPSDNGVFEDGRTTDVGKDHFIVIDLERGGSVFRSEVYLLDSPMLKTGGNAGTWLSPAVAKDVSESMWYQVLRDPDKFSVVSENTASITKLRFTANRRK